MFLFKLLTIIYLKCLLFILLQGPKFSKMEALKNISACDFVRKCYSKGLGDSKFHFKLNQRRTAVYSQYESNLDISSFEE